MHELAKLKAMIDHKINGWIELDYRSYYIYDGEVWFDKGGGCAFEDGCGNCWESINVSYEKMKSMLTKNVKKEEDLSSKSEEERNESEEGEEENGGVEIEVCKFEDLKIYEYEDS